MSNVFLSYARTHQPFVQRLHEALAERNKEGWVDWAGIPPAEEWMPQIEAAIDAANVFAFVITVDSLRSAVCARELDRAVARNKRLIPNQQPGRAQPHRGLEKTADSLATH